MDPLEIETEKIVEKINQIVRNSYVAGALRRGWNDEETKETIRRSLESLIRTWEAWTDGQ